MKLVFHKQINTTPNASSHDPKDKRYGCWGCVVDVYAATCRCDVVLDTGIKILGIPVATREWVNIYKDDNYVSGERNLPPKGSRVFIFMPTGSLGGAFILCSQLIGIETSHKSQYMNGSDDELNKKKTVREHILPGKWTISYNYDGTEISAISPDEKTSFSYAKNSSKDREVKIIAFNDIRSDIVEGKSATFTVFGLTFTVDKTNRKVTFSTGDLPLEISSNEKVSIVSKKGIDITSGGGTTSPVKINGGNMEVD